MADINISAVIYPNFSLSYGYWTGAGLTAGIEDPLFAPLPPGTSAGQANYRALDGFDAVSAIHDNQYATAEAHLLADLETPGVSTVQALSNYLSELQTADYAFAAAGPGATTSSTWGATLQAVAAPATQAKGDAKGVLVQELQNPNSSLATQCGNVSAWRAESTIRRENGRSLFNLLRISMMVLMIAFNSQGLASANDDIEPKSSLVLVDRGSPPNNQVTLKIPQSLLYPSAATGPVRNGVNLLVWSPDYTRVTRSDPALYGLHCVGFCNGRLLLGIEMRNDRTHIRNGEATYGDLTYQSITKWRRPVPLPPNIVVEDLSPQYGFDTIYEVSTYLTNQDKSQSPPASKYRYMFKKLEGSEHYYLFTECSSSQYYPSCTSRFALDCEPEIEITITATRYADSLHIPTLVAAVSKFVSAMVQTEACSKTTQVTPSGED